MIITLVEGLIMLIIVGALLYVTPGTLGQVKDAAPGVYASDPAGVGLPIDTALNTSVGTIATSTAGGVSLAGIAPIMIGIGLMILGFTFIRSRQG